MNIAPIEPNLFTAFVKTLEGQEITSRAGRTKFTVQVIGDGLIFVPLSSGQARAQQRSHIEKFLDIFNRTQSFVTTEYSSIKSMNASYMIALIALYTKGERL